MNTKEEDEFQAQLIFVGVVLFIAACLFLYYFPKKYMPASKPPTKQEQTISK
jgi:hypothetical protein